jgi:SAM-dependent methyltransferase
MTGPDWRSVNRANWDERVSVHLAPGGYDLTNLRAGHGRFNPIDETELPAVTGKRIVHLQCHFGVDSLRLVQRGASEVIGLDFSAPAIAAAHVLARELHLAERARFVQADVYDAVAAIPFPHDFDMVFVTWGALPWLPDLRRWSSIVASLLRPGGMLYLAEGHPAAFVFDDTVRLPDGKPGFSAPYFDRQPIIETNPTDYANAEARLLNATTYTWLHPMGELISCLLDAGLLLERLHEHDAVTWPMFKILVKGADGLYRWPDRPWLPLAFSLIASKGGKTGGVPGDLDQHRAAADGPD